MYRSRLIIPVLLAIFSFKCKPAASHKQVDVHQNDFLSLDPSAQTQFVPVLEKQGEKGKNVIYAASFALAWEGLRNKIGKPENIQSDELELLEQSGSYKGALASNEFSREATVSGQTISISVSFGRELTFPHPMDTTSSDLRFNGQAVRAFGRLSHSLFVDEEISIIYYKNDDEFIIKLQVEEEGDEIILAKGFSQSSQLSVSMDSIYAAMSAGRRDTIASSFWKYVLNDSDQVIIPVIRFDLDKNFRGIEDARFEAGNQTHKIIKAYQRIALVLNELGTRVESEAAIVDAAAAMIDFPVKPPVKHLVFDKPFVMILKKYNVKNPYFMMKVENTALMIKTPY